MLIKKFSSDGIEITFGIHTFPSTGYDRNENRTDRKVERKRVLQREPRISWEKCEGKVSWMAFATIHSLPLVSPFEFSSASETSRTFRQFCPMRDIESRTDYFPPKGNRSVRDTDPQERVATLNQICLNLARLKQPSHMCNLNRRTNSRHRFGARCVWKSSIFKFFENILSHKLHTWGRGLMLKVS